MEKAGEEVGEAQVEAAVRPGCRWDTGAGRGLPWGLGAQGVGNTCMFSHAHSDSPTWHGVAWRGAELKVPVHSSGRAE